MLPPFKMKLYYFSLSAPCRAVLLLCKEAQIPYDAVKVDLTTSEHMSIKFTEMSPGHSVPVIKDEKLTLFDGITILRYLSSKFKLKEKWYPSDITLRAKVDLYLDWHHNLRKTSTAALELTTGLRMSTFTFSSEQDPGELDKIAGVMKAYLDSIAILETAFLDKQDYLAGDELTIADLTAATEISFHQLMNTDLKSSSPKVAQWYERVTSQLQQWKSVHTEFDAFTKTTLDHMKKLQDNQQKAKKYGKDAKGGQKPPDICHTVYFPGAPHEVYTILTDEAQLTKAIGTPCKFSACNGGKFNLGDTISGTNLIFLQDVRILQSWRSNDWPQNTFSTVKLTLEKVENGTELTMTQLDVPDAFVKKTDDWWLNFFWGHLGAVLTRNIFQQVFFENAKPRDIYELLMDSAKLTKYTKTKCEIGRGVGGDFSLYDNTITGKNVELVTDAKIVQKWRNQDWPAWHYSTVTIEIKRVAGGTDLMFSQTAVPVDKYRLVQEGWDKNFWRKIHKEIPIPVKA
eukprot:TRINITY_DN2094_c0_g1_i1.p1 TRINITY_DN2094_c0_g1~~TRINITY_DN2094_c0_g1_i1.p1  ORF type:complete len:534 (-),score=134.79 TRINITY_DN2094_c0_g1_i1:268-1806(-)